MYEILRVLFYVSSYTVKASEDAAPPKKDMMSHPPLLSLARKFKMTHTLILSFYNIPILILKTYSDLWDNSHQNDVQIVEMQQKLTEQEPKFDYILWEWRQSICTF
jgi:hypothetical protein